MTSHRPRFAAVMDALAPSCKESSAAATVQSTTSVCGPIRRSPSMEKDMNRRSILRALGASLLAGGAHSATAAKPSAKDVQELQSQWRVLLASNAHVAQDAAPLKRTDDEWRKQLPEDSYRVLRHEATERPFTSPLNDE